MVTITTRANCGMTLHLGIESHEDSLALSDCAKSGEIGTEIGQGLEKEQRNDSVRK